MHLRIVYTNRIYCPLLYGSIVAHLRSGRKMLAELTLTVFLFIDASDELLFSTGLTITALHSKHRRCHYGTSKICTRKSRYAPRSGKRHSDCVRKTVNILPKRAPHKCIRSLFLQFASDNKNFVNDISAFFRFQRSPCRNNNTVRRLTFSLN